MSRKLLNYEFGVLEKLEGCNGSELAHLSTMCVYGKKKDVGKQIMNLRDNEIPKS